MAEFQPSKKEAKDFNGGVEYVNGDGATTGDAVNAETINSLVESALYTQEQAEEAVNTADEALNKINEVVAGGVTSVNGETGAVTITPENIGAVNKAGDTMAGPLTLLGANSDTEGGLLNFGDIQHNEVPYKNETVALAHVYLWEKSDDYLIIHSQEGIYFGAGYSEDDDPEESDGGTYEWDDIHAGAIYDNGERVYSPNNPPPETSDAYATCSTGSSSAAKTVTKAGFVLKAGARITVKFTYASTTNSPTLNVSSTGAKSIKADGDTTYVKWLAGVVMDFVYDGTYWVVVAGYQLAGKPVGALYFSNSNVSPASLYGGSWTGIDGRVVLSSGVTTKNPLYRGEYDDTTQYYKNEIVYHEGTYYICKQATKGIIPPINGNAYWAVYKVGYQGGETTHSHSADNMNALFAISTGSNQIHLKINSINNWGGATNRTVSLSNVTASDEWSEGVEVIGNTTSESNMPPYQVECVWYRTA